MANPKPTWAAVRPTCRVKKTTDPARNKPRPTASTLIPVARTRPARPPGGRANAAARAAKVAVTGDHLHGTRLPAGVGRGHPTPARRAGCGSVEGEPLAPAFRHRRSFHL